MIYSSQGATSSLKTEGALQTFLSVKTDEVCVCCLLINVVQTHLDLQGFLRSLSVFLSELSFPLIVSWNNKMESCPQQVTEEKQPNHLSWKVYEKIKSDHCMTEERTPHPPFLFISPPSLETL